MCQNKVIKIISLSYSSISNCHLKQLYVPHSYYDFSCHSQREREFGWSFSQRLKESRDPNLQTNIAPCLLCHRLWTLLNQSAPQSSPSSRLVGYDQSRAETVTFRNPGSSRSLSQSLARFLHADTRPG